MSPAYASSAQWTTHCCRRIALGRGSGAECPPATAKGALADASAARLFTITPTQPTLADYTYGRVLRTQEPGSQPQVLSQLLSGLTASLRFLSGGRPPGMKASFRFSAGSGEGRAGVATRNRSFETWALSITKTTFLQRRVDFLSPRPTACCADRERYQLRFLQVITSHRGPKSAASGS